ncbi:hypothetical protein FA13DRAFT_1712917 [Coprinellus micaceus]|uniref:Uncharacterized protein n=1 Tax=Coprinellus micaceus TaxID=71717 RepID=A0A4Y7SYK6_COPMI|nr:hypothetical protein FA13DRAFT_1712917 [Coprinellus micaceus]
MGVYSVAMIRRRYLKRFRLIGSLGKDWERWPEDTGSAKRNQPGEWHLSKNDGTEGKREWQKEREKEEGENEKGRKEEKKERRKQKMEEEKEKGERRKEKGERRKEKGERRKEKGERRKEKGERRKEKGERRKEKGERRKEKGERRKERKEIVTLLSLPVIPFLLSSPLSSHSHLPVGRGVSSPPSCPKPRPANHRWIYAPIIRDTNVKVQGAVRPNSKAKWWSMSSALMTSWSSGCSKTYQPITRDILSRPSHSRRDKKE